MSQPTRSFADVDALARRISALRHPTAGRAAPHFFIEGIRHFVQAVDAHRPLEAIVISPVLQPSLLVEMLVRRLKRAGTPVFRVTPERFRALSTAERASGIGALVTKHWTPLEELDPTRGLCLLAIEELRSAGNLGTILRTAEACGVGGVLFLGERPGHTWCDPFDPAVLRAGMGGVFHLPLVRTTHAALTAWRERHRVTFVGLAPSAAELWTEMPRDRRLCLVLGEERRGLTPELSAQCDVQVRLPMTGRADSLNVGIAAGVALYELMRRVY
jgi:TrmH family RNA methyltransferase